MGSAYGGDWIPKKEDDKRFLGNPGSINSTHFNGKKGGYDRDTKIGTDGRATIERHYTDHGYPKIHTDPHDHEVIWDANAGFPHLGPPINYPDGAPGFKHFKEKKNMSNNVIVINSNPEENRFETISDFKWCMKRGGEVQFEWNNKDYYITHPEGLICIYEPYKEETAKEYKTVDEALEHVIDGQKLREIITKVTVWERNV